MTQDHTTIDTDKDAKAKLSIHIDKKQYFAPKPVMTGAELRALGAVGENRTLWREVPGGEDELVEDATSIKLKDGMHFYTAAKTVTPG